MNEITRKNFTRTTLVSSYFSYAARKRYEIGFTKLFMNFFQNYFPVSLDWMCLGEFKHLDLHPLDMGLLSPWDGFRHGATFYLGLI